MTSFSKRSRCSGLGDITEVLITILDTYSGSLVVESELGASSSQYVLSLQDRFEDVIVEESALVCLTIAENAEDVSLWSRSSPKRGTITLVGDAVTHDVICSLFKDEGNGVFGFADGDVCCST